MNKRELEERVLTLAQPLLRKLYGEFSIDQDQNDRPDAAIVVHKPHKRFGRKAGTFKVGIEITTVDKMQDIAYLRDKKFGCDRVIAQTIDVLEKSIDSNRPTKKVEIEITGSYIYDGAIRKKEKFADYVASGIYREIILLCFSDLVATDTGFFANYLLPQTNYLFSRAKFPFNAVVFTSLKRGDPIRVYKKTDPLLKPPKLPQEERMIETVVYGPTMRVGKKYNLNEIMANSPIITPKQKIQRS